MDKSIREKLMSKFNGAGYVPARDDERLSRQIDRGRIAMADGQWRTLGEIADITGDPEASISAQLRHLRKAKHGGHKVYKEHVENGLFLYKLELTPKIKQLAFDL